MLTLNNFYYKINLSDCLGVYQHSLTINEAGFIRKGVPMEVVTNTLVAKKDGSYQVFDGDKIINAIRKSAERTDETLTSADEARVVILVQKEIEDREEVTVQELHEIVMSVLYKVNHAVYVEYKAYRNYKERFKKSFANTYELANRIINVGDNENANRDSQLTSTKSLLIANGIMKELMKTFELKPEWVKAHEDGWLYIHDMSERFLTYNCNLFDMAGVLKDGFELNGIHYEEPTTVGSAMSVAGDIILCASSQQYGGFSVPQTETAFVPYAEKSYKKWKEYYLTETGNEDIAERLAVRRVKREIRQGVQNLFYKLNSVNNSLGQVCFSTFNFGLDTSYWGRVIVREMLEQRKVGLGKNKIPALFPKMIMHIRSEINGSPMSPNYDLKQLALECAKTSMYPDFLSCDEGYLKEIYDETKERTGTGYGLALMGCRAHLSKAYHPATGNLLYTGRFNIGAVTLNLVKFAIECGGDMDKFYAMIDKYSAMAFEIHRWTYKRLSKQKASSNPLFFCEGGSWMKLKPEETIAPLLVNATASLGYIGVEEMVYQLRGSGLAENLDLGIEVIKYLREKVEIEKAKDGWMYALYATPSESLCLTVSNKLKEDYGIIEGVTDKKYVTNSHHTGVWVEQNAVEKQLREKPMFDLATGGRICFTEFPYDMNTKSLEQIVDHAMKLGLYFGINLNVATCEDCLESGEFIVCPSCGGDNIVEINRVCGYLGYSRIKGKNRFNEGKHQERLERVKHC